MVISIYYETPVVKFAIIMGNKLKLIHLLLVVCVALISTRYGNAQQIQMNDYRVKGDNTTLNELIVSLSEEGKVEQLEILGQELLTGNGEIVLNGDQKFFYIHEIADKLIESNEISSGRELLFSSKTLMEKEGLTSGFEYAYNEHLLAYSYYRGRDYNNRLKHDLIVLDLFKKLDNNEELLSHAYHSVTVGYLSTKRLEEAFPYYYTGLEHALKNEDHFYVFEFYQAIGNAINFYEGGLANIFLSYAKKYWEYNVGDKESLNSYFYIILGSTYTSVNKHEEALKTYKQGLKVFRESGEKNPFFKSVLQYYMGVSYKYLKQYELAHIYFDSSISKRDNYTGRQQLSIVNNLRQKGEVYRLMKEYDKALKYLNEAFEIENKYRPDDTYYNLGSYSQIGWTFLQSEQWDSAFIVSQDIICRITNTPSQVENYYETPTADSIDLIGLRNLIFAYEIKGRACKHSQLIPDSINIDVLLDCFEGVIQTYDILTMQNVMESSGIISGQQAVNNIVGNLSQLLEDHGEDLSDDKILRIWTLMSRTKSFQLINQKRKFYPTEKQSIYEKSPEMYDLQKERKRLENLIHTSDLDLSDSIYREQYESYLNLCLNLFRKTYLLSNKTSNIDQVFIPSKEHKEIIESMKENQVLIDYYISDDLMVIFQVSNNSLEYNVIDLPSDFESVLNRGLRNVKSGKSGKRINTNVLNKYLIDTWIDKCDESSELIVCYDQYLWKYPIELLKLNKEEFLIERMPVSYIYSPELYSSIKEFKYENDILLMAPGFLENTDGYYENLRMVEDIDSNRVWNAGNQLIPLPYSISEVSRIENLGLKKGLRVAKYTENMATKRTFFNNYRDTKIIHIATHGFASKTDTYKTGIFFAGQEDQSNFLSMNELYTEESHANLVVLSACQTGYGEILKGEGVMALPRGFLLSGVPNVVCSLWKIHDVKTRDLMMEFYKALLDGQSYSKSLQLARKKLIEEGELPMDWGVMIHIGSN